MSRSIGVFAQIRDHPLWSETWEYIGEELQSLWDQNYRPWQQLLPNRSFMLICAITIVSCAWSHSGTFIWSENRHMVTWLHFGWIMHRKCKYFSRVYFKYVYAACSNLGKTPIHPCDILYSPKCTVFIILPNTLVKPLKEGQWERFDHIISQVANIIQRKGFIWSNSSYNWEMKAWPRTFEDVKKKSGVGGFPFNFFMKSIFSVLLKHVQKQISMICRICVHFLKILSLSSQSLLTNQCNLPDIYCPWHDGYCNNLTKHMLDWNLVYFTKFFLKAKIYGIWLLYKWLSMLHE